MFKTCRILNRQTGDIFKGQIDTVFQGLPEYELVEIPDDGKIYESIENLPYYQEKLPTIEEQKQALLEAIDNLKKTPFTVTITDINDVQGSYYLDLEDSNILRILVLVKKAEIIGQASDEFINADTREVQYKTFSLPAIETAQSEVIQKDDFLKLKTNRVKNAQTVEELQIIGHELNEF